MKTTIYFDNNATTALDPAAAEAMRPFLGPEFANPSSPYSAGRSAAAAIARSREAVATLIGAEPGEIVFTSGGTESNNAALRGALETMPGRDHLVLTRVEHPSVLNCARWIERRGGRVTWIAVDAKGQPDLDALRAAVTAHTALVSMMAANNETGILLPVAAAAEIAHAAGAMFHTDAVQAAGKIAFHVRDIGADYASLGAHKMHGPKGIGALFIRAGAPFAPQQVGGDQEHGRRAGTENVACVAGFGAAASIAAARIQDMDSRVRAMRDDYEARVTKHCPDALVVGRDAARLPNTSDILFRHVDPEALVARLDMDGLCCSSGSACAAGAHEPSHVMSAMGLPVSEGWGPLRVSLGRFNTADEIECLVARVLHNVRALREPERQRRL
jgi:cysteine desulfurase